MTESLARCYLGAEYDQLRADEALARLEAGLAALPCQDACRAGRAVAVARAVLSLALHPLAERFRAAGELARLAEPAPF